MKNYKHYSFDLWGTLIRPNEKFEEAIALYIYNVYASSYFTINQIINIIRDIEFKSTRCSELIEKHIDSSIMINSIFERIKWIPTLKDIENVQSYFNKLFLENLPYLYDEHTRHVLKTLKEKGCSMNILSNTGFVSGKILDISLSKLEILDYFDFTMYSDEYGFAKPNEEFFELMFWTYLEHIGILKTVNRNDVIHIGDNPIADGGSTQINVDFFQINTNNNTILDLL